MRSRIKVVLVQCVCPHYRVPVFKKLAEVVDLKLYYGKGEKKGALKNAENIEGFKHQELFSIVVGFWFRDIYLRFVFFPTLLFHLSQDRPEVIISEGITNIINLVFIWFYCKLCKVGLIVWDSGRRKEKPKSIFRKLIEPLYVLILKQAKAIIAYGTVAKDYFLSLGIEAEKIFIAQNTIGVEKCLRELEKLRRDLRKIEEKRRTLSLENKKIILYVGALERRKKVENLIVVFEELKREVPNIVLLIIGDGPERTRLERLVSVRKISDCFFIGEVIEDISTYFLLCDIFVQPGWNSLAIIEAMAYGKPVVTVSYGGPEYEIIENNKDGIIVERDDIEQLENSILKILKDSVFAENMGKFAQQKVKSLSLDNMIRGFVEAIEYTKSIALKSREV